MREPEFDWGPPVMAGRGTSAVDPSRDEPRGLLRQLHRQDTRALHVLVGRRHRVMDAAMRAVTHFGDAAVTIGISLVLLFSGVPALFDAGVRVAIALAGSHLLVQLLKRTITRPRPQLPAGIASLIQAPDRFSFPSGHAAASLSVALGIAPLLGPGIGSGIVGLGMIAGVSRCYLGVHYPGDVMAGWVLALLGMAAASLF
ncbi:MAG: phosphatase PAP2 family protein [Gemmatimonadetes bacterium]|nr:phosphatase PAP2 family protein [Gemmatimonadota bacterium]